MPPCSATAPTEDRTARLNSPYFTTQRLHTAGQWYWSLLNCQRGTPRTWPGTAGMKRTPVLRFEYEGRTELINSPFSNT